MRGMFLILPHFSCVIGRPALSSEKSARAVPRNSSNSFGPHTAISCRFMGEISNAILNAEPLLGAA